MNGLIFNIQKFSLHDGPGIRTNVFFQGCNLRCKWCANPESFELEPEGETEAKAYCISELMDELLKDKVFYQSSGGGITLTGGEALLQPAFVSALCDALHEEGIAVLLETAACVSEEVFTAVMSKCDILYIDLKHYTDEKYSGGTGAGIGHVLTNINAALNSGIHTVIRIPVVPGYNNTIEDINGFAEVLSKLGAREIHLLPFHQLGSYKYTKLGLTYAFEDVPGLHERDLEPFAAALRRSGFTVQIGG